MKYNIGLISFIIGLLALAIFITVFTLKPSWPWQLFFVIPVVPLAGLLFGGIAIFKDKHRNYLSYLGVSLNGFLTIIYSVIAYLALFGRV